MAFARLDTFSIETPLFKIQKDKHQLPGYFLMNNNRSALTQRVIWLLLSLLPLYGSIVEYIDGSLVQAIQLFGLFLVMLGWSALDSDTLLRKPPKEEKSLDNKKTNLRGYKILTFIGSSIFAIFTAIWISQDLYEWLF